MTLSYTLPNAEKLIIDGNKIHTMRADRVNRWHAGREIHHVTGNRTKEYRCFLQNKCISTQQILLVLTGPGQMAATIDRIRMSQEQIRQLALNDGFSSTQELMDWFFKDDHTMWAGRIIHWTKKRYE